MKRYLFALSLAAAAACFDLSNPFQPAVVLSPILDSVFVGDALAARSFVFYDRNGRPANPGAVTWSIAPASVATIDGATGVIQGVGKGAATITLAAGGATGTAQVIVSRALDMTLLMDTVVLMQGDTFTIPVAIQKKDVLATDTTWFDPSPDASVATINTANGLVEATGTVGTVRYVAYLTTGGADTVSDTGAVIVLHLTDTTETGQSFQTLVGTERRHQGGAAGAFNYTKADGSPAFLVADSAAPDNSHLERTVVTLTDGVIGAGTFEIDSISPQEATGQFGTPDPFCSPRRPWAYWNRVFPFPSIVALSHGTPTDSVAGQIAITQYQTATTGGAIISGRYLFIARRTDQYGDVLGSETVRGTFVAPLRTRSNTCLR